MKVITEKGGVKASSVNDRSIEHSISQKTELSKKNEKELSGKTVEIRRKPNGGSLPSARNTPAAKLLTAKSRFQNLQLLLAFQNPKLKLTVLPRK